MKRKISLVLTVLFLLAILLPIAASAHKGNTDAYGGHYDRSTGQYHYHHGYRAHQHTDTNGDGVQDCPYDFKDMANHTSGASSDSSETGNMLVSRVPDWVYLAFPILCFIILLLALLLHSKNQDLSNLRSSTKEAIDLERKKTNQLQLSLEELSKETDQLKQKIVAEKSKIVDNYRILLNSEITDRIKNDIGENYLCSLANAPPGSYVDELGMPHCIVQGNDIYIFYLSSTRTYHAFYCHHAKGCKEINALQIKTSKSKPTPCSVCAPVLPDTDWVFRYVQYKELLDSMKSEEATQNT